MLNQVVLVGRLVRDPEIQKLDNKKQVLRITLAVPRSFKNSYGVYETDFIDCTLWDMVAKNTTEYCGKGDIIAVKGRIETSKVEKDNAVKYYQTVIAEKVTFLATKGKEEKEADKEE